MKALVSVLTRAAAPGEVITSSGRGATAAQPSPASTPNAMVPAATASAATTARTPSRRQERTASSPRAGSGKGIGTDMVGSSVRDRRNGRRGQGDHDAADTRPGPAEYGHRDDRRQAVRRACQAAPYGRRAARSQGDASGPERAQPPAVPGPDPGPAQPPGGRGARPGRPA